MNPFYPVPHDAALGAQAPGLSSPPSLPHLCPSHHGRLCREQDIGWEPRALLSHWLSINLPDQAQVKTRSSHRNGPGCWDREVSEAGLRRQEGEGRGDDKRNRVKVGEGEMVRHRKGETVEKQDAIQMKGKDALLWRWSSGRYREEKGSPAAAFSLFTPWLALGTEAGKENMHLLGWGRLDAAGGFLTCVSSV